MRGDQKVLGLT